MEENRILEELPVEKFDSSARLSAAEMDAMLFDGSQDADLMDFISRMDEKKPPKANRVHIPEDLLRQVNFTGTVYGFLRQDSGYHVILGWEGEEPEAALGANPIGSIGTKAPASPCGPGQDRLEGWWENGVLRFRLCAYGETVNLDTEIYTLRQSLFSRHSGLIETDWMDDKCVLIAGCGSVGSCIALQLARSGVGRFILMDTDCMEIHNVCRHQCGLSDVGRYKVDAVEERILRINPSAQVRKFYQRIQDVPTEQYADWLGPDALVVGTCDNRVGNAYACDEAYRFHTPFLALGFMARAWAGEIYICLPERGDICYRCAFRSQIEGAIAEERRNHTYLDMEDAAVVHFEPGLDVDLEFGISFADKIALDILNRRNRQYHFRLLHTLKQFVVFSGTADRPKDENFWSGVLPRPVDYRGVSIRSESRRADCPYCSRVSRERGDGSVMPGRAKKRRQSPGAGESSGDDT